MTYILTLLALTVGMISNVDPVRVYTGGHEPFDKELFAAPRLLDPDMDMSGYTLPDFQTTTPRYTCKINVGTPITTVCLAYEVVDGKRLLYVDQNMNGDLSDDEVLAMQQVGERFEATVDIKVEPNVIAHFELFQQPIVTRLADNVEAKHGYRPTRDNSLFIRQLNTRKGELTVGSKTYSIRVWDHNTDGRFNGEEDWLQIDYNEDGVFTWVLSERENYQNPQQVIVDEKTYEVIVSQNGDNVLFIPEDGSQMVMASIDVGDAFPFKGTLGLLNNDTLDPSDLENQWVLIDFWGEWCAPCISEMPDLKALHQKYKETGFEIVGFLMTSSSEVASEVVAEYELVWPNIFVTDKEAQEDYMVQAYPTKYLINREGQIVAVNPTAEEIEGFLQSE